MTYFLCFTVNKVWHFIQPVTLISSLIFRGKWVKKNVWVNVNVIVSMVSWWCLDVIVEDGLAGNRTKNLQIKNGRSNKLATRVGHLLLRHNVSAKPFRYIWDNDFECKSDQDVVRQLENLVYTRVWLSLRKHAYSNILKISPPKTESFHIKFWYVLIFLIKI